MGSKLTVLALLVAAIAFVVQMAAGVTDTPTIPPGLVAILVAAGLVAFLPGRSVPLAGPAAGLFNLVAFVLTSTMEPSGGIGPAATATGRSRQEVLRRSTAPWPRPELPARRRVPSVVRRRLPAWAALAAPPRQLARRSAARSLFVRADPLPRMASISPAWSHEPSPGPIPSDGPVDRTHSAFCRIAMRERFWASPPPSAQPIDPLLDEEVLGRLNVGEKNPRLRRFPLI